MTEVQESDLQAYVDGVAEESRRAEVEAYLAERPEEAGRVRPIALRMRHCARCLIPCLRNRFLQR